MQISRDWINDAFKKSCTLPIALFHVLISLVLYITLNENIEMKVNLIKSSLITLKLLLLVMKSH